MDPIPLQYPFEDRISPFAESVEQHTRSWLYQGYRLIPPEIKKRYAHTKTGYLTARFFPLATYERLLPLAMSSLWGLAFDDYYEHATPKTFSWLKDRIGTIIRGGSPRQGENELFYEMKIMAEGFQKFMPGFWMDRFARSMETYIDGMGEEAPYKAKLCFPTLETYMDIRWRSVDVLQMIDGLEVATEMPLPDEVRHHPLMEEITKVTCRIIAWCNDYFSYQKEAGRDVMNLVLVLQHETDCSLDKAVSEAVRIHDQDVSRYLTLKGSLPDFGKWQPAVKKFLAANELMIAGHWRWYITDTTRYQPGGSPDKDVFAVT